MAKCVVGFYLDWLDSFVDRRDDEGQAIFGHLTAALHRLVATREVPFVVDGPRCFPVPADPEEAQAGVVRIDMKDFAGSIAERLFDIEAREPPPRVFPHAIRVFGLTPRTPESEISGG